MYPSEYDEAETPHRGESPRFTVTLPPCQPPDDLDPYLANLGNRLERANRLDVRSDLLAHELARHFDGAVVLYRPGSRDTIE